MSDHSTKEEMLHDVFATTSGLMALAIIAREAKCFPDQMVDGTEDLAVQNFVKRLIWDAGFDFEICRKVPAIPGADVNSIPQAVRT